METLLVILLLLLFIVAIVTNIICFVIGARVGQKVDRGERVEFPSVNLAKAMRAREAERKARAERDRVNTIMENLENYDGTPFGQKHVPRGGE